MIIKEFSFVIVDKNKSKAFAHFRLDPKIIPFHTILWVITFLMPEGAHSLCKL